MEEKSPTSAAAVAAATAPPFGGNLYNSGLVGDAYIKSFLPSLNREPILPFCKEDFEVVSEKGEGSFGEITHVMEVADGGRRRDLAIKRVPKDKTDLIEQRYPREYVFVRALDHPNIGKFHELREDEKYFYMIGDYYPGGDLYEYIDTIDYDSSSSDSGGGGLGADVFKSFARQLICALDYCHQRGIIHSDVKLENIVLGHGGVLGHDGGSSGGGGGVPHLYLIDFGFAVTQAPGEILGVYQGTPPYAASELHKGVPHDGIKSDSWSLGVTLYILYFGEYPFWHDDRCQMKQQIIKSEPKYTTDIIPNPDQWCVDLIKRLLDKDPKKRPALDNIF